MRSVTGSLALAEGCPDPMGLWTEPEAAVDKVTSAFAGVRAKADGYTLPHARHPVQNCLLLRPCAASCRDAARDAAAFRCSKSVGDGRGVLL